MYALLTSYNFVGFPLRSLFKERKFEGVWVKELEMAVDSRKGRIRILKSNLTCLVILPKILVSGGTFLTNLDCPV